MQCTDGARCVVMARLRQIKPRLGNASPRIATPPPGAKTQAGAHLYKTARWQKLRLRILARDGYRCTQTGVMLIGKPPADDSPVVDHITPHRGDEALFWDARNLQSVSKRWHDTAKREIERGRAVQKSETLKPGGPAAPSRAVKNRESGI